ncbi:MAG: MFS transporter, partial [Planctomycetes bacterium]|nr:MFS transporter [Planctomycetota bacterium]
MSKPIELPELAKPSGASNVRFLVIAVTSLMAVLLYLDRFCLAFAATFIKEDLGLSDVQISLLWSAFFVSYALAQVPSGWMTDRFGARRMLTLYILFWSLFTALTGLAFGFVTLFIFRIGIGLAQAGAYPTGANIVSKWIPFRNRGTASSVISVGGRIGGWMAVFLTGILIVLFVPTSVPSKLDSKDILDAPRLCYEMVHVRSGSKAYEDAKSPEWKKALAKRFVEKLAPATRQVVQQTADRYRNALAKARKEAVKKDEPTDELDPDVVPLAKADLQQLVNDLNGIIADRELFKADELSELKLEKEADRLFARKRSELSDSEVDRLNRLVLEAMYRDSIRKVYGAGWRQVMWTYGFLGVLVAALFWWCLRNRPEEHPWANDAEAELIAEGRPRSAPQPHGRVRGVPLKR